MAELLNFAYRDNRAHPLSVGHLAHDIAPQFPQPSIWLTPVPEPELPPIPFAGHNFQAMAPPQQSGQQSGVPQISNINSHNFQAVAPTSTQQGGQQSSVPHISNINIDSDDLPNPGSAADSITIGRCRRTDSPCGLWVKANKRSLKRHAQKWHGVSRGGDNIRVPCNWSGCTEELQKSGVPRHTLRQHFGETFQCKGCFKNFTRWNCWRNHSRMCELSSLGYTVSYDLHTRVVDLSDMSLSQGSS